MRDVNREDLPALWERASSALRAALAGVRLSDETAMWVTEFLEANELGLAFETIVAALTDADPSQAVVDHLAVAAHEMDLEDDPAWRLLTS